MTRVPWVWLLCLVLTLAGVFVTPDEARAQQTVQNNVDRPGSDYHTFEMRANNPQQCLQACFADSQCKAWTFVKPNTIQGPKPRCWLKNAVPSPVSNACCASGVITVKPKPPTDGGDGCDPPICCKKPTLPQCNP